MRAHLTNREHFDFSPEAEASMSCGGTHHGTVRVLLGFLDAAKAAIEAAPHGEDCIRLEDHKGRPCDCWKSKTTVEES